ncbi:hypothetical protein H5410_033987 [Solanum commersonii]|uniref:Uncharacterized protein n=1 Tax=Solanum commersonii TaxID=4109 RepID=A0A9J5YQ62_SOLCO|nr:hypothetical protein H5410_033987 [Solanum commersonii]
MNDKLVLSGPPLGVAQWFGLGTSMLKVSNSKPLASESKGFAFWVELIAPGLPSAGYLSYVRVTTRFGGKGEGCGSVKVGAEVFVVVAGVDRREYTNRIGGFGDGGWDVDGS